MYDIRQFKPVLYFLLLLGISGFCMATERPGLWMVATSGLFINAWLVKTGRFIPMPRLLANLVTLGVLGFVIVELRASEGTPIITVGEFLVLLQLIKLFEVRTNRDYAQLLVLSLLLMVAAAISTASLLFGMTLIIYLFVSLYCCLLFHLKVETDHARSMFGQPDEIEINPSTLRQDQRYLSRSMRRLTGLVSIVAIVMAVVVFLFFPRGSGAGIFGELQFRPAQTLTGFSDHVSFQKIAQITKSEEVVARVEVYKGNQKAAPGNLLLRGTTLDVYTGDDLNQGGQWVWKRSPPAPNEDDAYVLEPGDNTQSFTVGSRQYRQEITLQPTGTDALFAIAGAGKFSSNQEIKLVYARRDGIIQSEVPLNQPIQYTVYSSGELPPADPEEVYARWRWHRSAIDPQITAYAHRPEVCGVDASGKPLANYPLAGDHSFDQKIAQNFEHYLRTEFFYTLDLTDAKGFGGKDPMVAFLYDLKRGHCEYFAGAMTLMCQSIDIPARFVSGFNCGGDDYNNLLGGYYVVKQSNAHAWCEVFTGEKWETFDPTSGREAAGSTSHGWFAGAKKLFDFLEYKWGDSVIAYDRGDRRNLIDNLDGRLMHASVSGSMSVENWSDWISKKWRTMQYTISMEILCGFIALMVLGILVAVWWYFLERWRLRKRARRIGLAALPASDQNRLARQLGFYDELLRILERHHIERPKHLTPLEFSSSLSFLPNDVYDDVHRLTALFYRIRYGASELNPQRRRRLAVVIARIQQAMDKPKVIREEARLAREEMGESRE